MWRGVPAPKQTLGDVRIGTSWGGGCSEGTGQDPAPPSRCSAAGGHGCGAGSSRGSPREPHLAEQSSAAILHPIAGETQSAALPCAQGRAGQLLWPCQPSHKHIMRQAIKPTCSRHLQRFQFGLWPLLVPPPRGAGAPHASPVPPSVLQRGAAACGSPSAPGAGPSRARRCPPSWHVLLPGCCHVHSTRAGPPCAWARSSPAHGTAMGWQRHPKAHPQALCPTTPGPPDPAAPILPRAALEKGSLVPVALSLPIFPPRRRGTNRAEVSGCRCPAPSLPLALGSEPLRQHRALRLLLAQLLHIH